MKRWVGHVQFLDRSKWSPRIGVAVDGTTARIASSRAVDSARARIVGRAARAKGVLVVLRVAGTTPEEVAG
jgi:hypothetical protein